MKKLIFLFAFLVSNISLLFSQTWVQTLNGIAMWSICKDIQGNIYAGTSGTTHGIYKTTNGGQNWNAILSNGTSNYLGLAVDSSGNVFAANLSNGLLISSDGGANWTTIPIATFGGHNLQSVACGKNGYVYVGCISGGVYTSTDYGQTFGVNNVTGFSVVTLYVDAFNSNKIFAGTSSSSGTVGVYISTDAGMNFSGPYNNYNVWGFVQPAPLTLYMATTSTGYPFTKTTDGGYNWATISAQPGAMRGITQDIAGNIYICGNGGVFKSTNGGANFLNAGLTASGNQIVSSGNKIFATMTGSTTGGVWILTDTTLSNIHPVGEEIPDKFFLNQNYPNPFNPETIIDFSIPEDSRVSLTVYDMLGRKVSSLLDGENRKAGNYSVKFNGADIPSGIYFYKITAGSFTQTKKMILIK